MCISVSWAGCSSKGSEGMKELPLPSGLSFNTSRYITAPGEELVVFVCLRDIVSTDMKAS